MWVCHDFPTLTIPFTAPHREKGDGLYVFLYFINSTCIGTVYTSGQNGAEYSLNLLKSLHRSGWLTRGLQRYHKISKSSNTERSWMSE